MDFLTGNFKVKGIKYTFILKIKKKIGSSWPFQWVASFGENGQETPNLIIQMFLFP